MAFTVLLGGMFVSIALGKLFGIAAGALAMAAVTPVWFAVLRIRCGHCGAILARRHPFQRGGAILLWAVSEKCPQCRQFL